MNPKDKPFLVAELLAKQLQDTISPVEAQWLAEWIATDAKNKQLIESLEEVESQALAFQFLASIDQEEAWKKVTNQLTISEETVPHARIFWRYAVAALIILIGGGALFTTYLTNPSNQETALNTSIANPLQDLEPGSDKALLTLADGSIKILEDFTNGTIQVEQGVQISKIDGQVTYTQVDTSPNHEIQYNTITTPIGGQYQIVLPDHSKVWLNSQSSLRFPTSFTGAQRTVHLTGEGYFEVTKNAQAPFVVQAEKASVQVLGTRFNVMHYDDEAIAKITLVEGSVQVINGHEQKLLEPGQQATISNHLVIQNVDTEEAIAWKNGFFQFDNDHLQQIMQQLKRWYGVEVAYESKIPDKHFTGIISRKLPLSKVLHMLEMSGEVQFKIKDKTIYIYENITP